MVTAANTVLWPIRLRRGYAGRICLTWPKRRRRAVFVAHLPRYHLYVIYRESRHGYVVVPSSHQPPCCMRLKHSPFLPLSAFPSTTHIPQK